MNEKCERSFLFKLIVFFHLTSMVFSSVHCCDLSSHPIKQSFDSNDLSLIPTFYHTWTFYSKIEGKIKNKFVPKFIFANMCINEIDLSNNQLIVILNTSFSSINYLNILKIKYNHIESIDEMVSNWNVSSLTILDFSFNKINQINSRFSSSFYNLKNLVLESNEIDFICENAFVNLKNLTWISLSGNYLKTIGEYTFSGLINLNAFDLSGNRIEIIEDNAFKDLKNLTYLFLQHNQLKNLTSFLCDLKKLTNFIVSSNKISELSTNTFQCLKSVLFTIEFKNNQLTSTFFQDLNYLGSLYLSQNFFSTLRKESFQGDSRLFQLFLSQSRIETIEMDTFSHLTHLQYLYLDFNHLTSIKSYYFKNLSALLTLYLDRNLISTIEETAFNDLTNLAYLTLEHNLLKIIPNQIFASLNLLDIISLAYNQIKRIDYQLFSNLTSLTILDMNGNLIDYIEKDTFRDTLQLESLHLQKNRLGKIRNFNFDNLNTLKSLTLDNNILNTIETGSFRKLINSEIILSGNYISVIESSAFIGLNLKVIDLSNNQLDSFDSSIFEDSTIESLLLTRNFLTELGSNSLQRLFKSKLFNFGFNRISSISKSLFGEFKSELESLILSNNLLSDLDFLSKSSQFVHLKDLDLSANLIDCLEKSLFSDLRNLNSLNLANNNIKIIDDKLFNSLNLRFLNLYNTSLATKIKINDTQVIDLSMNKFENVSFINYQSLSYLYLRNVSLCFESLHFYLLTGLLSIDLSFNLDDGKFTFSELVVLNRADLSNMRIESLERFRFSKFKELNFLNLSHNRISLIENKYFVGMKNLSSIDLAYNNITWIEEGSFDDTFQSGIFIDVSLLNLSFNKIKEFSINSVKVLSIIQLNENIMTEFKVEKLEPYTGFYIRELDLSDNYLTILSLVTLVNKDNEVNLLKMNGNNLVKVDHFLFYLFGDLVQLFLNSNQINEIEQNAFQALDKLEYLTLSNNSLTYLEDRTFFNLIQLRTLNLSSNQIESFSSLLFVNLYNLKTLDISSNRLKFIDETIFQSFSLLQNLYLNDNSCSLVFSLRTFSNLSSIVNIYLSYSVLSDVTNKKYLIESLRPIPERFLGDLTFFRSINIRYWYDNERLSVDCILVIEFLSKNILVNLRTDTDLLIYLSSCLYLDFF